MKIIQIKEGNFLSLEDELCAAVGNFDGVHLGHQALINECRKHGYKSAVLTFYPHPSLFIKHLPSYSFLTPMSHKIDLLEEMGIDYLIIVGFSAKLAMMPKDEFITNMKKLNIKAIVCGYDFTFGVKGSGNVGDLKKEFMVFEMPKISIENVRVSSTYIKELLVEGEIEEAKNLLGRTYSIRGEVIYGNQVGRKLGYPTANIAYGKYVLPKNGVYAVKVLYEGKYYAGMLNIGNNPTLNFSEEKRLEVHIIGFDSMIYAKTLEVFFIKRIRSEKKFNNKEELLQRLKEDKEKCFEIVKDLL